MNEQEYERTIARLQNKIAALTEERDHYKKERDEYRAQATVFIAGFSLEGIISEVKRLQRENDKLNARLGKENVVEQFIIGKLFPVQELFKNEMDK